MAIRTRISDKEKQTQASIEEQVRETRELLVEPRGWHVAAEYRVKRRGSDLSRDPVYMQMIRDARSGKFARLCLHKFDRFARRAYDREVFEHILTRECEIELHTALEQYDLKTRAGKLTEKTSAFIHDVFLDNLAEETMKGMRAKVAAGGRVARAPFGYVNRWEEIAHNRSRRWVKVDPLHGETVRLAFRLFASGQHTLTAYLNDHGYSWHKGMPWRRDRLYRLLTNPFYAGLIRWNSTETAGAHEPFIDMATWEGCKAVLRSHDNSKERKVRHVYPLVGVLHFAELDCLSHAETQAHAGAAYYRSRLPGPSGARVYLPCEDVEAEVAEILDQIQVPSEALPQIRRLYREEMAEIVAPQTLEAQRIKRQLAQLEEESRGYVRLAA